uniref:Pimeloyl-ACP methyl ester carboxylesterase n=1 Tax=Candidatus Kentrum sp. SD TaxID=2126332 RepID=A0A450Z4D3_9GAMM|nr:MAG: Pimeloyl-ACP methyl ester carboxylesterase [Candidatus Kentron sp. SD]VFK48654.1 MAG: Pimeloyl-ACP methyl ester carboxylesterase [Candidatus Kentron sp. SD]VFK80511.1 MAG: Pimeloyl-ACP methyl ester carboxylesterase [Candidatus Kentron sp. SD]
MPIPTLPGINAETITTPRINTRVLSSGPEDGIPVLFLHGNLVTGMCWEEVMLDLPAGYRAVAPDQRGYGDSDPEKKIDATRGLGDLADDAVALLEHFGIGRAHIVGHSLGGSVVWRLLMDYPERFLSATQVTPTSPHGFNGTRDAAGTPCHADFAGSGGGFMDPEVVRCLEAGDRGMDNPFSPRAMLRTLIVKPPFVPKREEELVSAFLSTHLGERDYPGDAVPSPNWPYRSPGKWGPLNALSPKYAPDMERLHAAEPKTSILWVRGSHDMIISNNSVFDPATAGAQGLWPDWPGPDIYPPQPMDDQIRIVLEEYAAAGGSYREVTLRDAGHFPYLEQPSAFNEAFHSHIGRS